MNALQRTRLQTRFQPGTDPFRAQISMWGNRVVGRIDGIVTEVVDETHRSIVYGSVLTGAPGQPVDTGALRDSWRVEWLGLGIAKITTDSPYAWVIEHNYRNVSRSLVGAATKRVQDELNIQKALAANTPKKRGGQRSWRVTKVLARDIRRTIGRALGGPRYRNGGSHSVKLTRAGFARIVEAVRAANAGPVGVR